MEYVEPPRGALKLLNFFASEPDFAHVIGDLSEEFQQRAATDGIRAARHWYWRETFRNAGVFTRRQLLRAPVRVIVVTAVTFAGMWLAQFFGNRLLTGIQWAWIPTRYWPLYQSAVFSFLFPVSLLLSGSALANRFAKGRELSLIVAFATPWTCLYLYGLGILIRNSALGIPLGGLSLPQVIDRMFFYWALTTIAYSIPCLWMRQRRVAGLSKRTP
jgi:hypothetical protein